MSIRLGDRFIKLSTTVALNWISKSEEIEKGWRKDEIALPVEFSDLDPVHVIPLIDVGRLMLLLVTRSVVLSNTLYSLLLEEKGKFIVLGSEWIGSLVNYEEQSICFSRLISPDDLFYTDQDGNINDECEYFSNGVINNERFYIQNYVFDATFEIEFNFDLIELEFVQQKAARKMHVMSNPFFAFHDDVFPAFAKNAASQPYFPQIPKRIFGKHPITIVPDDSFSSLAHLRHISTFALKFDGSEIWNLQFEIQV